MFNNWLASVLLYSYNLNRQKNKEQKKIYGVIDIDILMEIDILKNKIMRNLILIWEKTKIFWNNLREKKSIQKQL